MRRVVFCLVALIYLMQIQLDCHGDVIKCGCMYTDSLVVEVAPAVNDALHGCQYSAAAIRNRFASAAQGASDVVRAQVKDVGAWLEHALENA